MPEMPKFTTEQTTRIDSVYYQFERLIRFLCPNQHVTDVRVLELADVAAGYLSSQGFEVNFPTRHIDGDRVWITDTYN